MKISIDEARVVSLGLKKLTDGQGSDIEDLKVRFDPVFYEDKNSYSIVFDIKLSHKNELYVELKYQAEFKTSDPIDEKFQESPFVYVNSPAIAYPFLRASLASIILNCGYDPVMLPAINFTKFKNE